MELGPDDVQTYDFPEWMLAFAIWTDFKHCGCVVLVQYCTVLLIELGGSFSEVARFENGHAEELPPRWDE